MSYRLKKDEEPVPEGIKRIAREQIDKALSHLKEPEDDPDEAIHEARKHFKKLRGLLRLVRDEMGESVYQRENVCFRDAGRRLSDMRDGYVMIKTLDNILDSFDETVKEEAYEALREDLAASYKTIRRETLEENDVLAEVAATIEEARERVAGWPVTHDDYTAVKGLRRVYKRGRNRLDDALDDPEPEAFHEWRKRVKYLWYNVRILRPIWKEPMDVLADEIHDLSDYLGDDHDLAELRANIEERPWAEENEAACNTLFTLLEQKREAYEQDAYQQGRRIYTEKPDDFVDRLEAYWKAWRS